MTSITCSAAVQERQQIVRLENKADPFEPQLPWIAPDLPLVVAILPLRRTDPLLGSMTQPVTFNSIGLPNPARADQPDDLCRIDRHRDIRERIDSRATVAKML